MNNIDKALIHRIKTIPGASQTNKLLEDDD
jgi:hypothetical protein